MAPPKETPQEKALREFMENFQAQLTARTETTTQRNAENALRQGATTTTPAAPRFPTSAENAQTKYNDMVTAGRQGGYAFVRDIIAEGAVRLPNGTYVNTRTGEQWNPITTTARGDPLVQRDSFGASRAEIQQAQGIARAGPTSASGLPTAGVADPLARPGTTSGYRETAARGGGFFPNQGSFDAARAQAPGGFLPGTLVSLDRG
mgnify:FL=1